MYGDGMQQVMAIDGDGIASDVVIVSYNTYHSGTMDIIHDALQFW